MLSYMVTLFLFGRRTKIRRGIKANHKRNVKVFKKCFKYYYWKSKIKYRKCCGKRNQPMLQIDHQREMLTLFLVSQMMPDLPSVSSIQRNFKEVAK